MEKVLSNTGPYHIKVELYIDDILVRHSDDNFIVPAASYELPIPLTYVDYDKEITGKQLKIKVEYTYPNTSSSGYVSSDPVQCYKYTDRTDSYPTGRQGTTAITGLAKNIDVPAYFSDPRIYTQINQINGTKLNMPTLNEFTDASQVSYCFPGNYYYMPNGYATNYLSIAEFDNNSMIRFNTDPDNDFTYDFTIKYGWYINKPFNFERGKSYIIAAENNTIYWSEVKANE